MSECVCSKQSLVKEGVFTQRRERIRNFYLTRSCAESMMSSFPLSYKELPLKAGTHVVLVEQVDE